MGVQSNIDNSGKELTIKVDGRFDFSAHQEFRDAYEAISAGINSYVVDLGNTSYLDSSALGMLLLLRDHAGGDNSSIKIIKCNEDVRKILTISNFEQLFTIQ
jgi:anti-anti-sigma factor